MSRTTASPRAWLSACAACALVFATFVARGSGDDTPPADSPEVTGEQIDRRATVRYQTTAGIYVDLGSIDGLQGGQAGTVEWRGETFPVEVVSAATDTAFLRATGEKLPPMRGETVQLLVERRVAESDDESRSSTLIDRDGERDDGFVPLLQPPAMQQGVAADTQDIFSARLTLRQLIQGTQEGELDYHRTQIRTNGRWDRIDGTPWSMHWSADIHYRGGDALAGTRGYEEAVLELYQLSLSRRFDDRSTLRLGRFIPSPLPSIGYLDGVIYEKPLGDEWRVGTAAGLKPRRGRLEFSKDEPTVTPYVSYAAGEPGEEYYTATAGFLASGYEGKLDRLALLVDQRIDHGPWNIYSTSEIDFDSGQADTREIVEVTRLNLHANYYDGPWTWRGGVDRYELTDSDAERDDVPTFVLEEEDYFEQGYWRGWLGAAQKLSDRYELDEEVSYTDSDTGTDAVRYGIGLTRRGLPGLPNGSLRGQVYNLEGPDIHGFGGRLSAYLPSDDGTLAIQPSLSFRWAQFDLDDDDFFYAEGAVRAHWLPSRSWSMSSGVSYGVTEDDGRFLLDISLTYRW